MAQSASFVRLGRNPPVKDRSMPVAGMLPLPTSFLLVSGRNTEQGRALRGRESWLCHGMWCPVLACRYDCLRLEYEDRE